MSYWTTYQLAYLTANYPTMDNKDIAEMVDKTPLAVRVRANKLGMKKQLISMGMSKEERHRLRAVSRGNCPRCGKPAAPYYLCAEHREYERARGVNGRARTFKERPRRTSHIEIKTGTVTRMGHVTVHRMEL
jgi:hypothetical protein